MNHGAPESRRVTRPRPIARAAVGIALALLTAACDRLERFDLAAGEAYCGAITLGGSYRLGLSPRVQMRLRWDGAGFAAGGSPGTLSTFDAGADEGLERLVDEATLRPFEPLAHDPLSELEFGDGRERNLVYGVSAADTAAEALMAIVSLRSDDQIEVRLMRPGTPEVGDVPGRGPIFGLFVLSRQEGDCF